MLFVVHQMRENSLKFVATIGSQNPISKAKYSDLVNNIERMSRFFHFVLTKLTVAGVVLPDLLITLGNYFIYDLGDESYYLSAPMMYVLK